ncbi:MAG: 50S ribosomal protein L3 N(5)-glutamine methyltransferase [Burkholderiaceae bacterium]
MTLGECIARGEAQFLQSNVQFGQGTLTAWDEARWLVLAALDLPVDSPIEVEQQRLTEAQVAAVNALLARRIQERQPAAYLTHTAWLKGYSFYVDERVIIPRSFIAELIMDQFQQWGVSAAGLTRVLDACTGSGCLAILLAETFPQAAIVASDLSAEALEVAAINVSQYGLADRIRLVHSDALSAIPEQPFDLIVSNPPYVPAHKRARLPPEFRQEPDMALIAPDAGMAVVRQLLRDAPRFLSDQGLLVIEIGHEKKACQHLLKHEFGAMPVQWVRTAEQHDNVFVVSQSVLRRHPWRSAP